MRGSADLNEGDVDRLFAGRASSGDPELGDLERFFADLERACPTISTESWAAAHVAAMAKASELRLADAEAAARPTGEARGLMSLTGGRRAAPRGSATRGLRASGLARVAAFAAVLALVFGGVAFANALPGPLQDFFAGFAQRAGINFDGGAHESGSDGRGEEAGAPASHEDPGGAQGQKPEKADGTGKGSGNDQAVKGQVDGKADQAGGGTGEANGKADQAGGGTGEANGKANQAGGGTGEANGKADQAGGASNQSTGKADKDDKADKN